MNRAEATLIGLLFTDGCLSPKGKSGWRFYFSNKSEKLVAVYGDGTLPEARLPVQELLRHTVAEDFLRAAFSSDGGVNLYVARRSGTRGETKWLIRGVYIACAHPALRRDYCTVLNALGIRVRNVAGDGKVKIETEEDIRTFQKKVGFTEGVRITHTSRFWPRIEKQDVLNRLVESYNIPSAVYRLPQFDLVK